MNTRILLAGLCLSMGATAFAQSGTKAPVEFIEHASLTQKPEGVVVTAASPRPMLQALTAIRRQYGWVLDYEEGKYGSDQLTVDADGRPQLRGAAFQVTVPAPASIGDSEEAAFLTSFIGSVGGMTSQNFALQNSAFGRFTVTISNGQEPLMLDTPIHLPRASRTIDDTIGALLSLVSDKRGTPVQRGGLVDPGLMRTTVTVGGDAETPARNLLIEALNAADIERVWSLSYEPEDGKFYIGIELALRAGTGPTGKPTITPIWNSAAAGARK